MGKGYPSDWSSRRRKVLQRDNHRCQRCGANGRGSRNTELHVHHVTPKSDGGSHRLGNLKTVCKSCHQNIHGHGVGGRPSSSSTSANNEHDPEDLIAGIVGIVLLAALIVTGVSVTQVLPKGQAATQSYELDFHLVNDPDRGTKYSLNNGPPLYLEQSIQDNVIPSNEETEISFRISNPTEYHLQGRVTVVSSVGWRGDDNTLLTIDYDLPPDTSGSKTVVVKADALHEGGNSPPLTSHLTIENQIHSEEHYALHPEQQSVGNDEITVRKPLFDRFGFLWLCFVGFVVALGTVLGLRHRF